MLAYGINHHTTPIAIREKLAFHASQLTHALQDFAAECAVNEAVILSTCHRTEIYTNNISIPRVQQWLTAQKKIDINLNNYCYSYHGRDAVRHIMRVASGLDSMILGEPQILGQLKQAYQFSENVGLANGVLKHLFPAVFAASKHVRTQTDIGAHPVSLAFAIVQVAKRIYESLDHCRILLIGAGETIQLIATHFQSIGVKNIVIANRTLEKSDCIAQAVQAHSIHIQDIPAHLKEIDIVISATASQLPILGKGLIESTLKQKHNQPLLLIDLAVPRDIEPEVAALPQVNLYNIDNLQTLIADNLKNRQTAAKQAEMIIELEANQFYRNMRVFHARHVITEYRHRLDKIRLGEQEKALHQLEYGQNPKMVLEQFGQQLINKILHHPTVKLREAASEEQCEIFQRIKTFFELE